MYIYTLPATTKNIDRVMSGTYYARHDQDKEVKESHIQRTNTKQTQGDVDPLGATPIGRGLSSNRKQQTIRKLFDFPQSDTSPSPEPEPQSSPDHATRPPGTTTPRMKSPVRNPRPVPTGESKYEVDQEPAPTTTTTGVPAQPSMGIPVAVPIVTAVPVSGSSHKDKRKPNCNRYNMSDAMNQLIKTDPDLGNLYQTIAAFCGNANCTKWQNRGYGKHTPDQAWNLGRPSTENGAFGMYDRELQLLYAKYHIDVDGVGVRGVPPRAASVPSIVLEDHLHVLLSPRTKMCVSLAMQLITYRLDRGDQLKTLADVCQDPLRDFFVIVLSGVYGILQAQEDPSLRRGTGMKPVVNILRSVRKKVTSRMTSPITSAMFSREDNVWVLRGRLGYILQQKARASSNRRKSSSSAQAHARARVPQVVEKYTWEMEHGRVRQFRREGRSTSFTSLDSMRCER